MNISRRLLTLVAVAATTAGGLVTAPTADAQEKNIVLLGDSLMANPTFAVAEHMQGPGKATGNAPGDGRCPRGESRIAASLQRATGGKVEDFACTGAVAYAPVESEKRISKQVDTAINQGQLNGGTTNVLIQIGMNDTWKAPGFYNVQSENFVNEMKAQVGRVKAAAPNAKVTFLSYPSIVGTQGEVCPVHVNNAPPAVIPVGAVRAAMDSAHDWQRQSAAATGSNWVNLEAETSGHDMCAPKEQRWVTGIIDNSSDPYNITTHLTHRGNDEVAKVIARHL